MPDSIADAASLAPLPSADPLNAWKSGLGITGRVKLAGCYTASMSDMAGHGAPQLNAVEVRHTLSIHDVERELVAAGVPRSHRQVVRYCETGMLDAVKVPGPTGPQWFVAPSSLPKTIGDLRQWQTQRAGRGTPQPAMTRFSAPANTGNDAEDMARHGPPSPAVSEAKTFSNATETHPVAAGYVGQLEKRIEEKDDVILLLKGQLISKDEQIKELSTRYRETHTLLGAMQRMLAPLLGQSDPFKASKGDETNSDQPPAA